MNFLAKFRQQTHKTIKINKISPDFTNHLFFKKNKQNPLNIGLDGFFPKNKWKMPRKMIGGLIITLSFQLLGFYTPLTINTAFASETGENSSSSPVILSNGAPLNDLEIELLQQELIITKSEPVRDFYIAAVDGSAGPIKVVIPEPAAEEVATTTPEPQMKVVSLGVRTITSYNSEPAQTDDTPCITANGFDVCKHGIEDTIAANFLPFGTQVRIPDLFGDRTFIVRDRMNERYPNRMDVWMLNKADSKLFGIRRAEVQLLVEQ